MFIGLGVRGSRWAVGLDTGRRVDDDEDNTADRPPATSHQPLPAHNDHFLWQLDPGSPASTRLGEAALCAQVVTGWGPVTSECHIYHLAAVWILTSASKRSIRRFVITEKAFSWLKAATTAFTFKALLRHYAKGHWPQVNWAKSRRKWFCKEYQKLLWLYKQYKSGGVVLDQV